MDLPPADQLLASAVQYLIQGDEKDAALVLLHCEAEYGAPYEMDRDRLTHITTLLFILLVQESPTRRLGAVSRLKARAAATLLLRTLWMKPSMR